MRCPSVVATKECYWTKTYVGRHDVFYKGFREGKGIWGTWEYWKLSSGGFKIWPLAGGSDDDESKPEEKEQPVDAVGEVAGAGTSETSGAPQRLEMFGGLSQRRVAKRKSAAAV